MSKVQGRRLLGRRRLAARILELENELHAERLCYGVLRDQLEDHFGERAIEVAESDWIGRAITCLRLLYEGDKCTCRGCVLCRALLAEVERGTRDGERTP